MIEKMEKTPTGWGEGYRGALIVRCKRLPPEERPTIDQLIDCTLIPEEGKSIHLYGDVVQFENIDIVNSNGTYILATNIGDALIACYVDSGMITCYKEKKK